MTEVLQQVIASLNRGECIGLDAEFTGSNEMLELAVIDIAGETIFESLFTPARSRRWSRVPHGITPAMTKGKPKFAWRVPRVQRIVNKARYLVGFALENDIAHLRAEKVEKLDTKQVLDLRDWFWHIYGRHHGFDYREGVGLSTICDELQVSDDTLGPHRAASDTRCTLRCFTMLLERFVDRNGLREADFHTVVRRFYDEFEVSMAEYRRAAAAGFISLMLTDEGTPVIKANKERPADSDRLLFSTAVENRHAALGRLAERITGHHRTGRIVLSEVSPKIMAELHKL